MNMQINQHPHPTMTRGMMSLSRGRASEMCIDTTQMAPKRCSFFGGHQDRLAVYKDAPGSEPKMPSRHLKWTSQDAWSDPANHRTLKIR